MVDLHFFVFPPPSREHFAYEYGDVREGLHIFTYAGILLSPSIEGYLPSRRLTENGTSVYELWTNKNQLTRTWRLNEAVIRMRPKKPKSRVTTGVARYRSCSKAQSIGLNLTALYRQCWPPFMNIIFLSVTCTRCKQTISRYIQLLSNLTNLPFKEDLPCSHCDPWNSGLQVHE